MDFAITPAAGRALAWEVVCLREERGGEVAVSLATFGHRGHAEAFLADLVAMIDEGPAAHADRGAE
jgi:hypothetical protein